MTTERTLVWSLALLVAWSALAMRVDAVDGAPRPIVSFRLVHSISTKTAHVGAPVELRTTAPITITAEAVTIPSGSAASGVITRVVRPGRIRGRGQLAIRVVSIADPDGGFRLVTPNSWEMEAPRRPPSRSDGTVPVLTGMAAGYGAAMVASQFSNSAETIAGTGVVAAVTTIGLVAVLRRGEELVLGPGFRIDVMFEEPGVVGAIR